MVYKVKITKSAYWYTVGETYEVIKWTKDFVVLQDYNLGYDTMWRHIDRGDCEIVDNNNKPMIPRVEAADFEVLEQMAKEVEAARERRLAVRHKLGLD